MEIKKTRQMYEELSVLLSEGLDWIACYSRYPPSHKTENVYNPTQAVIAAAFHALQREDVEAFMKIHRIENLSYFQYPYMKSWLKEDHKFSKKIVARCLTTLAWLVVEEILSPQSPFVAAVTGLEEKYNLCGIFVQAVVLCSKRTWKVAQTEERMAPEMKSASTQTCLEVIETVPELGTRIENVDCFTPPEPEVSIEKVGMVKISKQAKDRNQENSSLASTETYSEEIETVTETVDEKRNYGVTHLKPTADINKNKIIQILNLGEADIDPNNISVKTLLQHAVERESSATVNRVMKLSRDLKNEDKSISGILNLAVKRKCIRVIKALLWHGLDTQFLDEEGNAPLHIAAASNYLKMVRMLTKAGANVNQVNGSGQLPLHLTADTGTIRYLLEKGTNVDAKTPSGDTALHLAVSNGNIEAAKALLVSGAMPNEINASGLTPLLLALQTCNQDMVDLLVGWRAVVIETFNNRDENATKERLETIMEVSEENETNNEEISNNAEAASSLPKLESFQDLRNDDGLTYRGQTLDLNTNECFHKCVTKGRLESAVEVSNEEKTEDGEISKDSRNDDAKTPQELTVDLNKDVPIHKAAAEGRMDAMMEQLDGGVDVDTKGCGGYTALQYAAKYGHLTLVQSLLQRGADINLGNDWNWTPLHHAAHYSRYDIVEFLLEAGANSQVMDIVYGKTPLSWATCNFNIIKLFKTKGVYN